MPGLKSQRFYLLALMALVALAAVGSSLRRRFIQTWFRDGPAQGPPPALSQPRSATGAGGLAPVPAVRVLLLDGLGAQVAAGLPTLSRLCAEGDDLELDVGFPTVSLPVQASLWTGLTQQQLGLLYRIKPLLRAPEGAAPLRISDSVAVAEEQAFIAGSFGFHTLLPPATGGPGAPPGWSSEVFSRTAVQQVASTAALAFVHVLRIDKAGHKAGAASPLYAQAAAAADQLLGRLLAAAPPGAGTRWFVLADHGHRARGGHGGAEPEVAVVRACIAGAGAAAGTRGRIHLIDLSRAIFDSLGLTAAAGAVGRPLGFALAHPEADTGGSQAGPRRAALPLLLLLAGLAGAGFWTRRRGHRWTRLDGAAVAWLPLACVAIWIGAGPATLSNPIIYPPQGRDIVIAALPGLIWLMVLVPLAQARGRQQEIQLVALALIPVAALAVASLLACGGVSALIDPSRGPPLVEPITAWASVLLALLAAAAAALALAGGATALVKIVAGYLRSKRAVNPGP